jgi:hypothetical protein
MRKNIDNEVSNPPDIMGFAGAAPIFDGRLTAFERRVLLS